MNKLKGNQGALFNEDQFFLDQRKQFQSNYAGVKRVSLSIYWPYVVDEKCGPLLEEIPLRTDLWGRALEPRHHLLSCKHSESDVRAYRSL